MIKLSDLRNLIPPQIKNKGTVNFTNGVVQILVPEYDGEPAFMATHKFADDVHLNIAVDTVNFLDALKGRRGELYVSDEGLMTTGDQRVVFNGLLEPTEMIVGPAFVDTYMLAVDDLRTAVKSAAENQIRTHINGVMVTEKAGIIATDGHRLFSTTEDESDAAFIIPKRCVDRVLRLHARTSTHMSVQINPDRVIKIEAGDWVVCTDSQPAKVINSFRIIKSIPANQLTVSRKTAAKVIAESINVMPKDQEFKRVMVHAHNNQLCMRFIVDADDHGVVQKDIESVITCDEFDGGIMDHLFTMSCEYLLNAVKHIDSDTLRIHYERGNRNQAIHFTGDGRYHSVVMPMRD